LYNSWHIKHPTTGIHNHSKLTMAVNDDWGTNGLQTFVEKQTTTGPDASLVKLRSPFVVVVVGASRGIGAGVAESYAKAGATGIVLAARRMSGLETVAANCKKLSSSAQVEIVSCDITKPADVEGLAKEVDRLFGRLDVAVVNAGFSGSFTTDLLATDPAEFANASNVNYVGTFLCAKYLIPNLLATADGARAFVAVGTLGAGVIRGPISNAMYCVSKAAQARLMEFVHEKFHDKGINAFTVHPGAVKSEMAAGAPDEFQPFLNDSPDLCGNFIVWLTKDGEEGREDKKWMSGRLVSATWDIDGLVAKKDEVVKGDLLKLTFRTK
jgi:NAD(P)-dependent dehydrogenase (short-subunit alcohol dehydrogenase family)